MFEAAEQAPLGVKYVAEILAKRGIESHGHGVL